MANLDWSQCPAVERRPRQGDRRVAAAGNPYARRRNLREYRSRS